MNDLDRLYQQTILDYNNRKDIKYEIKDACSVERGHNPSCGDDITLYFKIENEKIVDVSFTGNACAICTASTAMLIDDIKLKSVKESKEIIEEFFKMMKNEESNEDILNDASILSFVSNMPARIKCATLSWHTAKVALM